VTHLHEQGNNGVFLTSITDITCTVLGLGDVLSPNGLAHLSLTVTGRSTFTGCETNSGASCEAKELGGPAEGKVMKTATEQATVVGEGEVLLDCSSTPHCVYNGNNLIGSLYGPLIKGPNGEGVVHEATVNKVSGFFCPSTSKIDALATSKEPLYISS
jgi:hypothetical protein